MENSQDKSKTGGYPGIFDQLLYGNDQYYNSYYNGPYNRVGFFVAPIFALLVVVIFLVIILVLTFSSKQVAPSDMPPINPPKN